MGFFCCSGGLGDLGGGGGAGCWVFLRVFCSLPTQEDSSALARQMDRHLARSAAFNRKGTSLYNCISICYKGDKTQ